MLKHFRPKAGRFGVETNCVSVVFQGTLTDSDTTPIYIPVPYRKAVIGRISVVQSTLVNSSGTVTATAKKYSKSGAADVSLTAATDLKAANQTAKESKNIALLTTLTDAQTLLLEGDSLRIDVAASSTISTAPVNLAFSAELLILE